MFCKSRKEPKLKNFLIFQIFFILRFNILTSGCQGAYCSK